MEFKEVISDSKIFSRKTSDYRVLLNRKHLFGYAEHSDRKEIERFIRSYHPRPRKVITEYSVYKRIGGLYRYVPNIGNIYFNEYHLVMIILRNKYEMEIEDIYTEKPKPNVGSAGNTTHNDISNLFSYSSSTTTNNR